MNKMVRNNLLGIQALELLLMGHVVRRKCWIDGYYIRICNEAGYDSVTGFAVPQRRDEHQEVPLYVHATDGYFMHIGVSSQPFSYKHQPRDGEGLNLYIENDWEDYGFMSSDKFELLTKKTKDLVRTNTKKVLFTI